MIPLLFLAAVVTAAPVPADTETVKLVEEWTAAPVAELPPEEIDDFLKIDPESLPASLRPRYQGRALELRTLRHLAAGRRKGAVRIPEEDCAAPKEAKGENIQQLKLAGYQEIMEAEAQYLLKNTKCTERQLQCEFSVTFLQEKDEGVGPRRRVAAARRRSFIHPRDPLMALIMELRTHGRRRNTDFFGLSSFPTCAK